MDASITSTRTSKAPDEICRVKSYQATDLRDVGRSIDGSRWILVDQVNSRNQVILVSPDDDQIACFKALPGSGTDFIRARLHAICWAQDNDLEAPAPEHADGSDLIFAPLRMHG